MPFTQDEEQIPVAIPEFTQEKTGGELIGPKNVVSTASAAKIIYDKMREAHYRRARTYVRIQGVIDGNPPYSSREIKRGGIQAASNVNWRDAEAIFESVANAYWGLFNDVQYIAEFFTDFADPAQNAEIGKILSEEFDRTIRLWDRFNDLMTQHQADLIKFGSSVIFWPHPNSWQFDVVDVWKFLVPEKTKNEVSQITIAAIEHTISAYELWDIVNQEDTDPWKKESLKELLLYLSKSGYSKEDSATNQFQELQRRVRNGDALIEDLYNSDVPLVSLFIKELDGKISRGIIHPTFGDMSDWLYFSDREFENMQAVAYLFTFTPGEKQAHGNKGIGHRIFNTIEGITQIDNSLMDSIRRSSTVLIKGRATRGRDAKQIRFVHGGFVDIGESDFVQNLMGANLASSIDGVRYFRSKLEANNNISGAFMSNQDQKPRTLGELNFQVTKEARVQKIRIAHYYNQLDRLFTEIGRKMLLSKPTSPGHEYVQMWKDRCIARGVPEEFFNLTAENEGFNGLPEYLEIKATRASGSGSQFADQVEVQKIMQILPTLGERGRQSVLEDFVSAHRGYRFVARYLPLEDSTQQPTSEDTLASIENNQLEKGEMVVVSPDNVHPAHALRHMQRMVQISQAYNEAEDAARQAGSNTPSTDAGEYGSYSLEETDVAMQTIGPHFTRHLLYIQQDPLREALAKQLLAQWRVIANFADKIANNAQEHRRKQVADLKKQQEALDSMDAEERIKMRQVEIDAGIKIAKLKADMQRAAQRDSFEFLLERQKITFDNEIKKAKALGELSIEAKKAQQSESEEVTGKKGSELF